MKTSGGKGLHVVLPIKPTPWSDAKNFCHAVAASMEAGRTGQSYRLHGDQGADATAASSSIICATAGGNRDRALFDAGAAGRPVAVPDRLVRARRAQGRRPVHGEECDAAHGQTAQRSLGRPWGASSRPCRSSNEKARHVAGLPHSSDGLSRGVLVDRALGDLRQKGVRLLLFFQRLV